MKRNAGSANSAQEKLLAVPANKFNEKVLAYPVNIISVISVYSF